MKTPAFRLVSNFGVKVYRCGVRAGSYLRLRHDIPIRDHIGASIGKVLHAGEVWKVLPGSKDDVGTVRLMQPDGKLHTWDDDPTLFETFDVISQNLSSNHLAPNPYGSYKKEINMSVSHPLRQGHRGPRNST